MVPQLRSTSAARPLLVLSILLLLTAFLPPADGFSVLVPARQHARSSPTLNVFNKKKQDYDFSEIETRDMTRDEMKALNAENEKIMNAELAGMTAFSLVISIPMLYLVWVGLFAETAGDLSVADVVL
jgi:hypothetical protein